MAEMSNPTLAELAALFREVADLGHSIRCRYDPVGIDPESDFCTDGCRERATKARAFAEALEGKEPVAVIRNREKEGMPVTRFTTREMADFDWPDKTLLCAFPAPKESPHD